jgi:hypothetical protein
MKKDCFYAKVSFFLSLGFFIPLFNLAICAGSLVTAIMALKLNYRDPKKFGGRGYAIAALILSVTGIALTIIGLIIYLMSERICLSSICSAVINNSSIIP